MSKSLQINDLFWTLQGEGRWSGHRALFVRMPYCNYDCPWCDTEYDNYTPWSEESFIAFAKQEPSRFAVLTGGEPTLHKDTPRIISLLKKEGFYIACETNGSAPIPEGIDFPTISPKKFTKGKLPPYYIHPDNWTRAREWKYVVDQDFDFSVLNKHALSKNSPPSEVVYSLSPEFSHMADNVEKIINYIQQHPQWCLSLQTHKWIHIP